MAIYFIQAGTNGPIKIGQTSNGIKERMAQLQTGCPYELKLIWLYTGDDFTEQDLHKEFAHERVRGEWFRPTKDLFSFIRCNLENRFKIELPNGEPVDIIEYTTHTSIEAPGFIFDVEKDRRVVVWGIGAEERDLEVVVESAINSVIRDFRL